MDLEFQQLDLRYEGLRVRRPGVEKRLLASLAQSGQLMPIVVVAASDPARFTVVDGYKRVRGLRQLRHDTVAAIHWDLSESDALLLDRFMRTRTSETALEQGWLLREMVGRFALSLEELARRFDRSVSWVSRRLALVKELPEEIQERVRNGEIVAYAAMKYFVPLARANRMQSRLLAQRIAGKGVSSRQVEALYAAWRGSTSEGRARIVSEPLLFLRSQGDLDLKHSEALIVSLLRDLDILVLVARRAEGKLQEGPPLPACDQDEIRQTFQRVRVEMDRLSRRIPKEILSVGSGVAAHDPAAL
ncbi:MAG: ParB N-terminal domain-containing protein [Acidobacteria bacterium]|nr:ParB N-terminal domain-containing protein [Acidobacteriota bacterium]